MKSLFFIDSWAKQPWNLGDVNQQEAFQREASKLWRFVEQNDLFAFQTVDDVLKENQELKDELRWMNDVITNNISQLFDGIQKLSEKHNTDISNIEQDLNNLREMPLGTILPWVTKPSKEAGNPVSSLPNGWVRCDGHVIPEPSIWAGTNTPNLNGEGRFLRGSDDVNQLTLEDDTMQDHIHADPGHTHADTGHSHTDAGHTHTDAGHTHTTEDQYSKWNEPDSNYIEDGDGRGAYINFYKKRSVASSTGRASIQASRANIQTNKAAIAASASGVGGVRAEYKRGTETRPRNMNVIYLVI